MSVHKTQDHFGLIRRLGRRAWNRVLPARIGLATIFMVMLCVALDSSVEAQWPVDQTPVENPVPQYIPPTARSRRASDNLRPGFNANEQAQQAGNPPEVTQQPIPNFFDRRDLSLGSDELLAPNPLRSPTYSPTQSLSAQPKEPAGTPAAPKPNPAEPLLKSPPFAPQPTALPLQDSIRPATPSPSLVDERSIAQPTATPPQVSTGNRPVTSLRRGGTGLSQQSQTSHGPFLDSSIYRDRRPFPVDPRKPCNGCTQLGNAPRTRLIGNEGRPYQETELGGCQCDSRHPWKHPNFSVHWPRPFSARIDERHPARAAERYSGCPQQRLIDLFDPLSSFKLSDYQRTDNGYCGPGADRFGCLGESRYAK